MAKSLFVAQGLILPEIVTVADPAAGAEVTITVPARQVWEVLALRVALVTDATVANRWPTLVIDDGTTIGWQAPAAQLTAASQTRTYIWSRDGATFDGSSSFANLAPLLHCGLQPGWRIRTVTTNLQPPDNYGAPTLTVIKHVASS